MKSQLIQKNEKKESSVLEVNYPNFKHSFYSFSRKYFLICKDCFWMASTLPMLLDKHLPYCKKCPICENGIEKFAIPNCI